MERQVILVFNGVGSSGKSTTARALQARARVPLLHVEMDGFLDMMPAGMFGAPDGLRFRPGLRDGHPVVDIEVGPVCRRLLDGMRHAVAAMAARGNSMIVDDVMLAGEMEEYRRLLAGHDLRFVGFFAPLEVLEARERARGDREPGLARGQVDLIRPGAGYDLEIDSSALTPDEAAARICAAFGL